MIENSDKKCRSFDESDVSIEPSGTSSMIPMSDVESWGVVPMNQLIKSGLGKLGKHKVAQS